MGEVIGSFFSRRESAVGVFLLRRSSYCVGRLGSCQVGFSKVFLWRCIQFIVLDRLWSISIGFGRWRLLSFVTLNTSSY